MRQALSTCTSARGPIESEDASPQIVRVLLAEDDSLVRWALVNLLDRDPRIELVGVVGTVEDIVLALTVNRVDVVLADFFLSDGTACDLGELLKRTPVRPRLIVITHFASKTAAAACGAAGASLCLDRRTFTGGLVDALIAVAFDRPWQGPEVIDSSQNAPLSLAEARVLACVASGFSDAETAGRLGYSRTYVKKILVAVRLRLGARDRAHAAAMAAVLGLVRPDGAGRFGPAVPLDTRSSARRGQTGALARKAGGRASVVDNHYFFTGSGMERQFEAERAT
jgi:two-component system response regulator DesR